jgi:hypothetical protein
VHSAFAVSELERLLPLQNGSAARNIAGVCRQVLADGRGESSPSGTAKGELAA